MTFIVVILLFLKNICVFLNKLVLRCYNSSLVNPDYKKLAKNNQCKKYRSVLSAKHNSNQQLSAVTTTNRRKPRKFRGEHFEGIHY